MAMLFFDSFDHYATADILKKWTNLSFSNQTAITADGRNSTSALRCTYGNNGEVWKTFSLAYATLVVGFAFKFSALNSSSTRICSLYDSAAGSQLALRLNLSQKLEVVRGSTILDTGTTVLSIDTFYYIEFKATINNTTGAYEVRINATSEMSATGVNTRNSGTNNSADQVRLGAQDGNIGGNYAYYDDHYICDDSGSANNDFLGDVRVTTLLPSGAGTTTQWTPSTGSNYQNVDDTTPDSDSTFNSSSTTNQIDTYAYSDLSGTGTVAAVQTLPCLRKDDAGTRTVAPVVRSGGTDYVGSNLPNLGTSYQFLPTIYETDPDTAVAWTVSGVNGAEFGVKLIA